MDLYKNVPCGRCHGKGDCAIDTYKLLDEIESLVEEGKHMFGLTMISREDFFELTNKLRASLPDEMRRANRVNLESERIVGGARETAEQTLGEAQTEAQRVMEAAAQHSEKLRRDAETKSSTMIQEADTLAQKNVAEARAKAHQVAYEAKQAADKLVADAKLASEKMLADASRRAEHLLSDSEVMRLATAQAREMVASAEADAKEMRRGADEYAREELSRIERILTDTIITVQRGRNKLEQRNPSSEPAGAGSNRSGNSAAEVAAARR